MDHNIAGAGAPDKPDRTQLADDVRRHHKDVVNGVLDALNHALDAGDALNAAKESKEVPRGEWAAFVRQCGINERVARRYMQLAKARSVIEAKRTRESDLSLAEALRLLSNHKPKNKPNKPKAAPSPLTKASWRQATVEQRRGFLDAIGAAELCAAFSLGLRMELQRRVAGLARMAVSAVGETIAKGIRQALSLQKAAKPKDVPAVGVANALNGINNKLAASGLDLNHITIVIDPEATLAQKKAAA